MQKLQAKLKNTPKDTSLVPCSVNYQLNKVERLSVDDTVLTCNNIEVNQPQTNSEVLQTKVFVLSLTGNPLMPTKQSKARKMLKSGKAKIITCYPFTVQLTYETENKIQEVNLGIDTGYKNIGVSVVTSKQELICGTLILDGKTKERLDEKRMYRKLKRNRLWYRKPRFNNRKKKEGWLPPSIQRRYNTHLNLINRLKRILPISKVIIEIAKFDIQKIINPEITNFEYQRGDLYNYQNKKSYLMTLNKGLCEHCKKDFKNSSSHIHHRKPKSQGGSDRIENLMLLHEKCHKEIHKDIKLLKKYEKQNIKSFKHSIFMNVINKRFQEDIKDLEVTFGNITQVNRNKLNIIKIHYNDAFVIANGENQLRSKPVEIKQKHRNNRVLQTNRKGFKHSIRKKRSCIQPGDLFWVENKKYNCKTLFGYGKYIQYGEKSKKEYFKIQKVKKYFNFGNLIWN
jgi:hypothetical protein